MAGNVIGSVGTGATTILFDGHMDTVDVIDEDRWTYPPFSGQIADGNMYGRGTVDMKGALAISIYAAAIARDLGLLGGRKVYVAGSVMEEDYDGVAVHNLLRDLSLRPDYVIFGEATGMEICRGHNGRALIEITVHGKAAHGSRPELGINPVYRQQAVVARIEALAAKLSATPGEHGTLSLTNVNCVTASNNSVPESSSIVLDRRLCIGKPADHRAGNGLFARRRGRRMEDLRHPRRQLDRPARAPALVSARVGDPGGQLSGPEGKRGLPDRF